MAKKVIRINHDSKERKYSIQVVSQTIGLTEGQVSNHFKRRGLSVAGGVTAKQVAELIEHRDDCGRKFKEFDWNASDSLKAELKTLGWGVIDTEEDE